MNTVKQLLHSAAFLTGAKIIQRGIGLISTLILARILTPEDFAFVAIIAIVLHFFDILSQVGSEQYIIQKPSVNNSNLQTAWSLDLILKSLMFLGLLVLATPITGLLNQPQVSTALEVASVVLIINALRSPGIILLKRNLDYQKIFYLSLIEKGVSFITVIGLALLWQSYWAFVVADIVAALTFAVGSYIVSPFRPKLMFKNLSEQWLFSKWMLGKNILGYIRSQIDTLLVARYFSAASLGNYHMARDIAMIPAQNILTPALEPLLAALRKDRNNPAIIGQKFIYALGATTFLTAPLVMFTSAYPELLVYSLLGSQWSIAASLLSVMALLLAYLSVLLVIESSFIALGKVKTLFIADGLSLLSIISALLLLLNNNADLEEVVWVRALMGVLCTSVLLGYLCHHLHIHFIDIVIALVPAYSVAYIAIKITTMLLGGLNYAVWPTLIITGGCYLALFSLLSYLTLLIGQRLPLFKFLLGLCHRFLQKALSNNTIIH